MVIPVRVVDPQTGLSQCAVVIAMFRDLVKDCFSRMLLYLVRRKKVQGFQTFHNISIHDTLEYPRNAFAVFKNAD